jgi:alpha-N-arabinofuranosidase
MTGLVRNSDVVRMSSYAPLFAHIDAWQWTPDLIWFNNLQSFGSPNYYVQKLFSLNKGTAILPITHNGSPKNGQDDLYTTASFDKTTGEVVLILVNTAAANKPIEVNYTGVNSLKRMARISVIRNADLKAENSFAKPMNVAPVEQSFAVTSPRLGYTLLPNSLTVLRVGLPNK